MFRGNIHLYSGRELENVRTAARASAEVLDRLAAVVVPGMTTLDIDRLSAQYMKEAGGVSCDLGYHGYPGHICISLNDEVVHGIGRADRMVMPGDLVSLDVSVAVNGFCGDNARTICAGVPAQGVAATLMETTERSLYAGIAAAREGNCVNDIGRAVESVVTAGGFQVVRDMVGHGCGRRMHEEPEVPNYYLRELNIPLRAGMIICIEPMVNVGTWRIKVDPKDGWTCRTADGSLSAHFEHQILITKEEPEILTVCQNNPKTASHSKA